MAESFLVQIDLEKLRENLAAVEGRDVTPEQIDEWLRSKGFVAVPSGWVAEEGALAALDSSEVLSCWPL